MVASSSSLPLQSVAERCCLLAHHSMTYPRQNDARPGSDHTVANLHPHRAISHARYVTRWSGAGARRKLSSLERTAHIWGGVDAGGRGVVDKFWRPAPPPHP